MIAACCFLLAVLFASTGIRRFGDPGTRDFIAYWAAYQNYSAGGNPYDARSLLAVQTSLGWSEAEPLMMWNPPILFAVLAPVLEFNFIAAAQAWFVLNVCFLIATACVVARWFGLSSPTPEMLVGSLVFIPAWSVLALGQTTILLTLALAAALLMCERRKDFLGGALLLPLTIKPHVLYLFHAALLIWIGVRKRWGVAFGAIGAALAASVIISIQSDDAFLNWRACLAVPADCSSAPSATQWRPSTLVGWIRGILPGHPNWPIAVVPALTALTLAAMWKLRRFELHWRKQLPALLCICAFTSPYGGVYDATFLLLVQLILLARAADRPWRHKRSVYWTLLGIQLGFAALDAAGWPYYLHWPLFSLCMLAAYCSLVSRKNRDWHDFPEQSST